MSKQKQDKLLQKLIKERAGHGPLKGTLLTVGQVDSLWEADFPNHSSWRSYKHPENGWPEGPFQQIAEMSNLIRDEHMCQAIIEQVKRGERIFITMGASHAPRIENTLKGMIN